MASDPKKDLDKLRHFLKHKEVPVDVEETFTHFQESTGESSYDRYLSYLRDNKHIDENTFAGAHGLTGVEVTGETGSSSYMESIRYDLYDVIAEGAMGEIVLGRDRDLRRKVAIKVLKREHKSTPVMKRFITEAQVTAQLDHPNIIPVYSLEIDPDGNVSFAMKLIQGHTLKDVIHQMLDCLEFEGLQQFNRRFPLADRLDILLRVCDAMSYAHNRGVIHRDLKPANIMLGAFGEVYVMDWGIARLMEKKEQGETLWQESGGEGLEAAHVERTRVGHVVGTPRYMSPEQAQGRGDLLDERSDLYVLGLILFELVTLNKALEGERVDDVLKSASKGQLQPIVFRARGSRIPPPLKAVIQKATACEPADRYAHVADLAEDIRRFVRGQEVSAFPENLLQRSIRFMARHRMTTLLSVVSIIAMLALSASWSLYRQKSALQESRVRESRFVRFQSETDIRAHEIDTHFLRFENILTLLADTVAWQITYGRESDAPILEYGQLKTDKGLT
ncbi:MAG: serine/threonine protein kinase, partial [Spartobacteria bacterium]|nr:serine/threonine protein kinase [Spartobacteria bacterium]